MNPWALAAIWLDANPLISVWRSFQQIAHSDDLLSVTLGILGTAILLAVFSRRQRAHVRVALVMYGAALFLMALSAFPATIGWQAATRTLHAAGLLLVGFALVKLTSIILFDVVLCLTPLSPPQVLRDLMVAGGYIGSRTLAALALRRNPLQHRRHLRRHDRGHRFLPARQPLQYSGRTGFAD